MVPSCIINSDSDESEPGNTLYRLGFCVTFQNVLTVLLDRHESVIVIMLRQADSILVT